MRTIMQLVSTGDGRVDCQLLFAADHNDTVVGSKRRNTGGNVQDNNTTHRGGRINYSYETTKNRPQSSIILFVLSTTMARVEWFVEKKKKKKRW